MPKKFNTSRIYELPVLRHNTAAIKLIYSNSCDEELSSEFLAKAVEHIILDNIPVGCVYAHAPSNEEKSMVIDFICVLKSYQQRGIGEYTLNKLIERVQKELGITSVVVFLEKSESKEFFVKTGFEEVITEEFTFDEKTKHGLKMIKRL